MQTLSQIVIPLLFYLFSGHPTIVWLADEVMRRGPTLCHEALPTSPLQPLYDALVCGANLATGHEKQVFVDTGLIHLMVVSGSHLVFIEILLSFLPPGVRLVILGAYCFFTGFQAPVVRAFLRRCLGPFLRQASGLTSLQVEAVTIAFALWLYPQWILSRSFLMSWMCGLALCAPKILPRYPHLDQSLKSYVFLLPFCWASPVSVAWNTLLAPFVGIILFPACLLAMVIPQITPLTDLMWNGFIGILDMGPQGTQLALFFTAGSLASVPVLTHGVLLYGEVRWRRATAFSYSHS